MALPALLSKHHPTFYEVLHDWRKYRLTYLGGPEFRDSYLEKMTSREDDSDFQQRKRLTPVPSFAKAAINDIRNAIYQRLSDVSRRGGTDSYQRAINGVDQGVDRRGSTMNSFLGLKCLTELLVMGKVGIYVDMPAQTGVTALDDQTLRPYLYHYDVENIINWTCTRPDQPSEFQAVVLRDSYLTYDSISYLPNGNSTRFRHVWINEETGFVNVQFYNEEGAMITRDGELGGGPIELELTRIPFVLIDLGDSLIKDVCDYQIDLMNLVSMDINFAMKANFPFYIEQRDQRAVGHHLKNGANEDGTATQGGQGAKGTELKVGVVHGRYYDMNAAAPNFISPPSNNLEASMKLQESLKDDIRRLLNQAVSTLSARSSAESKSLDNQGLEAGLSFIGLQLESAERRIADFWSTYESKIISKRQIATIKYPDRYSLKTDSDRIEEAAKLKEHMYSVPSRTCKKEVAKNIATTLLGGKINIEVLQKIHREIDQADYTTSDPDTVIAAKEAGLVGEQVASISLGYNDDEYLTAREDHIRRATEIAKVQGISNGAGDPASRGVPDLSADPANAGAQEKEASRNTDLQPTTKKRVRGEGQ
jgi:hypothetical protein